MYNSTVNQKGSDHFRGRVLPLSIYSKSVGRECTHSRYGLIESLNPDWAPRASSHDAFDICLDKMFIESHDPIR